MPSVVTTSTSVLGEAAKGKLMIETFEEGASTTNVDWFAFEF